MTRACRYEPEVQRTYEDLAPHYGTTVLPARPCKPRDKAKVETAVLVVQRWILARIRNEVFATLAALNGRNRELLADLNDRVMRRDGKSRRELSETIERPALDALPTSRFESADWKKATVNVDYVLYEHHHGDERLEAACARAHRASARSYRSVESILEHGLDSVPLPNDDGERSNRARERAWS